MSEIAAAGEGRQETDLGTASPADTVLRAFSEHDFQCWPAWDRLKRALASNGGSFAMVGPRGAGKTWQMQMAVEKARTKGIGLWYPSPSEYDSAAFLISLTDSFAREVRDRKRRYQSSRYWIQEAVRSPWVPAVGIGLYAGAATAIVLGTTGRASTATSILAGVGVAVLLSVGLFAAVRAIRGSTQEGRLQLFARQVTQRMRFSLRRREALELGAQGGSHGLLAKLRASRENELTERPLTLSSLIQDFRELARLAGKAVHPAPVVIAIDELDKMADHDRVRQLLRDVKGIFGVENVYFLVSVSHEAARALNLNGLSARDEFNSSFEVVIELPNAAPAECADLLRKRGRTDAVGTALGILSGGVPRDLVRLAELVDANPPAPATDAVAHAIAVAMHAEAAEFRRIVISAADDSATDQTKLAVFEILRDEEFSPSRFPAFAEAAYDNHWDHRWEPAFEAEFGEEWKRLVVRLTLAGSLGSNLDPQRALAAQQVVIASSESSTVAQRVLGQYLGISLAPWASFGRRLRRRVKA